MYSESQFPSLGTAIRSLTRPSHNTYSPDRTLPSGISWGSAVKPPESSDEFSDAIEYNSDDDEFSDALENQPVSQINRRNSGSDWRSRWASSKPFRTLKTYYDRTKTCVSTAASNLFTVPSWISQITTSICNIPSRFRQTTNNSASNISQPQASSAPSQSAQTATQDLQNTSKPSTSQGLKKPRGPISRFAHTATTALTFLVLAQLGCSTLGTSGTDRRLPTDALVSATGSVCGVTASGLSFVGDKLGKGAIWVLGRPGEKGA